jgi:dUTP pyrophosphatase
MSGTILTDHEIRALIDGTPPLVEDYVDLEQQIQPNGFDLTVGEIHRFPDAGTLGFSNTERVVPQTTPLRPDVDGLFHLQPGPYRVIFNEMVTMPLDVTAVGYPRSSLMRMGVTVYSAVWDAGYRGRGSCLLVVHNPHGFKMRPNARVMQLLFTSLGKSVGEGYAGHYQGENADRRGGRN